MAAVDDPASLDTASGNGVSSPDDEVGDKGVLMLVVTVVDRGDVLSG